jgi:hypothetical protein
VATCLVVTSFAGTAVILGRTQACRCRLQAQSPMTEQTDFTLPQHAEGVQWTPYAGSEKGTSEQPTEKAVTVQTPKGLAPGSLVSSSFAGLVRNGETAAAGWTARLAHQLWTVILLQGLARSHTGPVVIWFVQAPKAKKVAPAPAAAKKAAAAAKQTNPLFEKRPRVFGERRAAEYQQQRGKGLQRFSRTPCKLAMPQLSEEHHHSQLCEQHAGTCVAQMG